ncbi:hypothetical protein ABZ154_19570 [Streptomyces sp. NPDC006261]|uniref:hypothetical protein n=1 Tax=Streptomyces sp. NPDC006261 TaxID=3156739 RepID=UPI0033A858BE
MAQPPLPRPPHEPANATNDLGTTDTLGRLPADEVEQLCLTNGVQQLEHLRPHEAVARRLAEGTLQLHGLCFHVDEARACLLTEESSSGKGSDGVFDRVGTGELERTGV